MGLFINIEDPIKDGIFDIIYDFIAMTTFTCAYLWIKRRILLLGLILYTIDFNIGLIFNPIISINNTASITMTLHWIGFGFNLAGFVCLLLGFWTKFNNDYLTSEPKFGLIQTLILIVLLTGLIQGGLSFL